MAFGAIGTVYLPTSANAGSSLWGTDVRKVLDTADAGTDSSTQTTHPLGGAVSRRTLDPYTNSSTDDTESNFGWAIQPSDMTISGSTRRIPSGDHTLTIRTSSNRTMSGDNAGYHFAVYHVGASPTFTRTLVQQTATGAFNYGTAGTIITRTATMPAVPQIDLAAGETVMWNLEMSCTSVTLNSRICTHYTGTESGVATKIDFPSIETLTEGVGSISGTGTPSASGAAQIPATGSISGTGTPSGSLIAQAIYNGSSSGVGDATGLSATGLATTGTSAGSANADGGSLIAQAVMAGTSDGVANADGGSLAAQSLATATAAGTANADGGSFATQNLSTASAAGTSDANGGVLAAQAMLVGSSDGLATVDGVSATGLATTGTSDGTATVVGLGAQGLGTTGSSNGVGDADGGVGAAGIPTVGSITADADVDGVGSSGSGAIGTIAGTSTVSADVGVGTPFVGTIDVGGGGGDTIVRPIFVVGD